jgi:hypothetical protein
MKNDTQYNGIQQYRVLYLIHNVAVRHYAECHFDECRYVECRGTLLINAVKSFIAQI